MQPAVLIRPLTLTQKSDTMRSFKPPVSGKLPHEHSGEVGGV
jgi:hypothetical protein